MPNNGKILSRKENFPLPIVHKLSTTMITRMLGREHFFFNQIFIPGFSIFMNNAQIPLPFGSTIGGTMFGCTPVIFSSEAKEGWDYWSQAITNIEPYMKDV